jgi:L-threonylcarbamoyladenylate synthase
MEEEIKRALEVLKAGGTILYPTDSIWGIGCDATNEAAVKKVYGIKNREEAKSLILLLDEESKLNKYVKEVPAAAWDMIEFAENPLTIIYSGAVNLPVNVINQDGSVAIRVTKDLFCRQLIRKLGKPIVSTSANKSGEPFPKSFKEITPEILQGVDYIVNLRQKEQQVSKPSVIIKIEANGVFSFIRK